MATLGVKLQQEREKRAVSLAELAERTRIGREYLEALERDAFEGLPGRAFGKLYIRAYAEKLGFDPDPLLDDYDRALREAAAEAADALDAVEPERPRPVQAALARWRAERIADRRAAGAGAPADVPGRPSPPESPPDPAGSEAADSEPEFRLDEARPPVAEDRAPAAAALGPSTAGARSAPVAESAWGFVAERAELRAAAEAAGAPEPVQRAALVLGRRGRAALAFGSLVLLAIAVAVLWPSGEAPVPSPTVTPAVPSIGRTAAPEPAETALPNADASAPVAPDANPPAPAIAAPAGDLEVVEAAVGRRVVDHRLVAAGGPFRAGQEVAFWTRVAGGRRGERIRHVWKLDGRTMQTIPLRLGGAHWRTHSTKTLNRAGAWAVEAHDADGAVLARVEFDAVD